MQKKSKNWIWAGPIIGVALGRVINRTSISYFGDNGTAIAMAVLILFLLCIALVYAVKAQYSVAIRIFIITIPLIIMGIGVYIENLYLGGFGFILIFILIPILKKFMPIDGTKNKNDEEPI